MVNRFLLSCAAVLAVGHACLAADASGTISAVLVAELPTPDSEGWYDIGVSEYSKEKSAFDSRNAMGIGYVDWQALSDAGLPSGAKVRLVGGVALDSLPDSYQYDFSGMKNVAVLDPGLFAKMPVPAGCGAVVVRSKSISKAGTTDGSSVSITWDQNAVSIDTCVTNYGWIVAGSGANNNLVFTKGMVGTGACYVSGAYRSMSFSRTLEFDGDLELIQSAQCQAFAITATNDVARIGRFRYYKYGNSYSEKTYQLKYNPVRSSEEGPAVLEIGKTEADGGTSYGGLCDIAGKQRRWAPQLCVCSNNTIKIARMLYSVGPLGLFAGLDAGYTVGGTVPSFDRGFGNVVIGNDEGNVDHCVPVLYPSPQLNLTFKGRFMQYTGSYDAIINYKGESNCVNRAFFDCSEFRGGASGDNWPRYMYIRGYSPSNLPRRITIPTFDKAQAQTVLQIADSTWTMPLDFGADDPDEINPSRCETNCKVFEIESAGRIVVDNTTTVAGRENYPTEWTELPLVTCSTGGETTFANWTVEMTGNWDGLAAKTVLKDTGVYVAVRKRPGFILICR